jgi:hypothetical protein
MQLRIPTVIKEFDTQWSIPQKIQSVISKIIAIDESLTILPWKNEIQNPNRNTSLVNDHQPLKPEHIHLMSENSLKTFFARIDQPIKTNDNFLWVDFRMQHSIKWNTLKDALAARLQKRGYSLYPRKLQSEKEVVIGWLLWSFREQDAELLAKMIKKNIR